MPEYKVEYSEYVKTRYITAKDEEEAKSLCRNMQPTSITILKVEPVRNFEVTFQALITYTTPIEASNEEEAKRKLLDGDYSDIEEQDYTIQKILDVKEVADIKEE